MLERDVIKPVNDWAEEKGIIFEKVQFVTTGYPDWVYLLPNGLNVWIEYKAPGKSPEPIQNYRIDTMLVRNQLVYWTDNSEHAIAILRHHMASQRIPEARYHDAPGPSWSWAVP